MVNDKVRTRLPVHCGLLKQVLFEVQHYYLAKGQLFLHILYKAMFAFGYYGLFRVGELTNGPHAIKAVNLHIAKNKDKMLVLLHSSKTHDVNVKPQKVKITANHSEKSGRYKNRHFCPFKLVRVYLHFRGDYVDPSENLFVHRDGSPVLAEQARKVLRLMISNIGLNPSVYDIHSLRIGRASDLIRYGYSLKEVKRMGRWKSNAVYKYIRQ